MAYLAVSRFLMKKRYIQEAYLILHCLVISIYITIAGCVIGIIYLEYTPGLRSWGLTCFETNMMYYSLVCVWFGGMLWSIRHHLIKWLSRQEIIENCFPAVEEEQQLVSQLAEKMGIKRKVELRLGYGLWTAELVTKWGHPVILCPANQYNEEQLVHIITHELFHYKNGDRWFRMAVSVLECIHWFNPLLKSICSQLKRVDELYCDYCVCSYGDVIPRDYAETLYCDGIRYEKQLHLLGNTDGILGTGFTGNKMQLLERVKSVMELSHGAKKKYSVVSAVLVICMIATFFTGNVVYAAASQVQNYLIINDDDMIEEELVPVEDDFLEYEIEAEEGMGIDYDNEITASSVGSFSATMEKGSSWYTGGFKAASGQKIKVVIQGKPSTVKLNVGIREPDGTKRYINFSGSADHTFILDQTGTYKIFVQNNTSKNATVEGAYVTLDVE